MNIYIARLVASLVAGATGWLAGRFVFLQFLVEPENQAALVALVGSTMLAVYSAVHKKLSQRSNPTDTAIPTQEGKLL